MAGRKEKVMYDPYNFAAVAKKFIAEQEAEKQAAKKEKRKEQNRASQKKFYQKVKQKRIETKKENIRTGEKKLQKISKKLDKATVTGPLGGKVKVKTLKKITGGKPIGGGIYGKGPLGKNFIVKKLNMGGVMRNRGGTFKGIY
jgi:uncharacterized protein YlxW (UPF0749 family)